MLLDWSELNPYTGSTDLKDLVKLREDLNKWFMDNNLHHKPGLFFQFLDFRISYPTMQRIKRANRIYYGPNFTEMDAVIMLLLTSELALLTNVLQGKDININS